MAGISTTHSTCSPPTDTVVRSSCAAGRGRGGKPTIPTTPSNGSCASSPCSSRHRSPHRGSALLLTRLPGHPPGPDDRGRDDFTSQLADTLAQVHAIPVPAPPLPALRLNYDRPHATLPDWLPRTQVWTRAVAAVREPPPPADAVLLHRDYHPENTLWSGGRLSGVVDWTQASTGPAQFDLGHMRWNLVADHGQQAADRFLTDYRAASGRDLEHQPYWDLVALLDLLLCSNEPGDQPGDITPGDLHTFEQYAQTLLAHSLSLGG
ncbi:MAG: phosphotransferase family protein [Thermoplasmata archaeon]